MPWSSNQDLPESVRSSLPEKAQTVFRDVANERLASGDSEEVAIRQAWSVVGRDWEKPDEGDKWVEKVGARHTRGEYQKLQEIHDNAVKLGATCEGHEKRVIKNTLYVSRKLLNAKQFIEWAKAQGFETTLKEGDLHVTIGYSKEPMEWPSPEYNKLKVERADGREVKNLDGKATVLTFRSSDLLNRWDWLRSQGASWEHEQFTPHVTISWEATDLDLSKIEPYEGPLEFGPEVFAQVKEDWKDSITEKFYKVSLNKFDKELGIAYGWAIICKENGKDYFDTQGDHIPEDEMVQAAAEFMRTSRIAGDMHRADTSNGSSGVKMAGSVVFAYPMTTAMSKSLNIKTKTTGLLIGMKIEDPVVLEKFRSGEYTGFSIGGRRIRDELVD